MGSQLCWSRACLNVQVSVIVTNKSNNMSAHFSFPVHYVFVLIVRVQVVVTNKFNIVLTDFWSSQEAG